MARGLSPFKKTDVTRAVLGAAAGGMDVGEVLIEPGKIIIRARRPLAPAAANDDHALDDELREHEAQHGQG